MEDNVTRAFETLAEDIFERESAHEEVEPCYARLLDLIAAQPSYRDWFSGRFIDSVLGFRNSRKVLPLFSIDAIAYCMHELRWPEVLAAVISEHETYFAIRRESTLARLIDAFSDDWSEASDYYRFAG